MPYDPFLLSSYHYHLPEERIAQRPMAPRDASRLMIINRKTGQIEDRTFRDLADLLQKGDSLVFNNARVIPARLIGKRSTGGESEIFLLRRRDINLWEALARPGKKLGVGSYVHFTDQLRCEICEDLGDGKKLVLFSGEGDISALIEAHGRMPLPPYIKRSSDDSDSVNYQTIFAKESGAVAAPTAGLHFTQEMLHKLQSKNVQWTTVTLDVGLGTFQPIQTPDIRNHLMHAERYYLEPEAVMALQSRDASKLQVCVGTTSCRVLESAYPFHAGEGETNIFIYPGYKFKYVQTLLTNFHLPGSSLLMLVSAFAGYELIMEAYTKAVRDGYRFFSYGDAMLIL